MIEASYKGHTATAEMLLSKGAAVDKADEVSVAEYECDVHELF